MRLNELIGQDFNDDVLHKNLDKNVEILGMTADSRNVLPGYMFAALPGSVVDGAKFIGDAVKNGARLILAAPEVDFPDGVETVLRDANPRRQLALLAQRFFKFAPPQIFAVTGTNGKTSVATFIEQILTHAGQSSASMGTLGVKAGDYQLPLEHTTPEPVMLHAILRDLYALGVESLAMEVSSHALAQFRVDGVKVNVAGFTNLSRDHLDYHENEHTYLDAKARLFSEVLVQDGVAVINRLGAKSNFVEQAASKTGRRIFTVDTVNADLTLTDVTPRTDGLDFTLTYQGETLAVTTPVAGVFQAENIALAAAMCLAGGLPFKQLRLGLEALAAPVGRMEQVVLSPKGVACYVDYAHTPDALTTALMALRPHCKGRLICVFGCGGDRDAGKRAEMGRVAAHHSDDTIVTDDNPRNEDAALIRQEIMQACPAATEVADRREAIKAALRDADAGDIILVAGKGHETGQIVGDKIFPFSDHETLHGLVEELTVGKGEDD